MRRLMAGKWRWSIGLTIVALLLLIGVSRVWLRPEAFPLRHVRIMGQLDASQRAALMQIAKREIEGNFFTLDIHHVRQSLKRLPWIRQLSLQRRWPDTLDIRIEAYRPLARWKNRLLVDVTGALFEMNSAEALPQFNGPEGSSAEMTKAYIRFCAHLSKTPFKIMQLDLSERRAWQLTLSNGIQLALGREHVDARLNRFSAIYATALKGYSWARVIDLRYPNGMALSRG